MEMHFKLFVEREDKDTSWRLQFLEPDLISSHWSPQKASHVQIFVPTKTVSKPNTNEWYIVGFGRVEFHENNSIVIYPPLQRVTLSYMAAMG